MFENTRKFIKSESGSVTTDWVVLVASLILLSVLVMATVTGSAVNLGEETGTTLAAMSAG